MNIEKNGFESLDYEVGLVAKHLAQDIKQYEEGLTNFTKYFKSLQEKFGGVADILGANESNIERGQYLMALKKFPESLKREIIIMEIKDEEIPLYQKMLNRFTDEVNEALKSLGSSDFVEYPSIEAKLPEISEEDEEERKAA
ncbi:MAG: hypothetical protein WC705_00850 [Candidatus Paceibacterota bacterium]|jgi:hypothetical protein